MRLRPRPNVKETYTSNTEDEAPFGTEMPHKAQRLLGTKVQVNVNNSKDNKRSDFAQVGRVEQKNFVGARVVPSKAPQIPLPKGISDMPSWSTAAASTSSSDLLPTPTTASPRLFPSASRNGSSTGVQTSQFYPNHQQSIESMRGEYYDPSKQPLYVSQQTSASAVRDMALHKGSPKVHEMSSDQIPPRSTSKKPKKLDLSSLFPRPQASQGRLLSPAKYTYSPSAVTDLTEFFPPETMRAEVRRQGTGRFETHKNPKPAQSEASSTPRVKIFEPDIYDVAKTNQRKPPKGIKNWFDGFDISSDEEEIEPVELPANPPRPSVEQIPSDFSPYGVTAPERVIPNGGYTTRPMQETLHPMDPAKAIMRRRNQRGGSESSTVTEDSSGGAVGHKRSGESRIAHSRLDSQSVLSLSSESEEEKEILSPVRDSRYALEDESTLGANLPSPVARRPDNQHSVVHGLGLRTSDSTAQTGSIPIRLRDSTAAPIVVENWAAHEEVKTPSQNSQRSPGNDPRNLDARSRTTTRSAQERTGLKSSGGETSSSVPSDASRVMAVTEEEMMLLELMRSKRAAMQNNSFREGYRLALKQEQDFLSKRRQSAHNSVSKMLEERANREGRFSPESNPPETVPEKVVTKEQAPPSNRYSVFRKQDVDKGFKIDRFLSQETPQGEPPVSPREEPEEEPLDERTEDRYVAKMARMERFLMMKPSLADAIYDGRPLSGTEIETDTMTATEDEYAPSPMQRLAGMREELRISSPLANHEAEDESEDEEPEPSDVGYEEHHDKVRAFLQSAHASGKPSLTALPQIQPPVQSKAREEPPSLLSPSIPEEEYESSEAPEVSPNLTPAMFSQDAREAITPRQPSFHSEQSLLQPTSKFQDRSRVKAAPPTELPTSRKAPSSISTGFTSPLSQSFSISQPEQAITEPPRSRSPSYASSPHMAVRAKRVSRMPTRIDTSGQKTVGRVTSMSSMTSAGEDVLAAWAELGGGSDAFAARRRGR